MIRNIEPIVRNMGETAARRDPDGWCIQPVDAERKAPA